jgi:hypothetical protein
LAGTFALREDGAVFPMCAIPLEPQFHQTSNAPLSNARGDAGKNFAAGVL